MGGAPHRRGRDGVPRRYVPAALNIATNLALNLLLSCLPQGELYWLIYPLELAVVAIEYAVYAYACGGSKKLFLLTLAANVLSYCIGLALFGHV